MVSLVFRVQEGYSARFTISSLHIVRKEGYRVLTVSNRHADAAYACPQVALLRLCS